MKTTATLASFLALGAVAAAQTTVQYSDASGLAAEAEFSLASGGTTLVVRLKNVSTGVPSGFDSSDQILTTVSFDLGAPGANPLDPQITGGSVQTGSSSQSLNFSVQGVGSNEDVSGEYGYGNTGTTALFANFVSAMQSHSTPFGGPNLDGPTNLDGPQAGLVPKPDPIVALGGIGAIRDEIVATLLLDQALTDLSFLGNGSRVEFGSDAAFVDGNQPCTTPASSIVVPDRGNRNANGTLFPVNGPPTLGNSGFGVAMDAASGECALNPCADTMVFFSFGTASVPFPNVGCTPGTFGEIMIDVNRFATITGQVKWNGPGQPAVHPLPVPNDLTLCGAFCAGQGLWMDPLRSSPFVLTNRVDLVFGS